MDTPRNATSATSGSAIGLVFTLVAIFVAALNLRAGITSVGPVLSDILGWYDASPAVAGLITAMPGAFFAVMGLCAVPLAERIGMSRTLLIGMSFTLTGLAVRPWTGSVWLFLLFTAFVVVGIALSNVLLPAWIKLHGGRNIVTLMTVNTTVLGISGALGPLSAGLAEREGGWRDALFVWVSAGLAQVLVWLFVAVRNGYDFPRYRVAATETPGTPGTPGAPGAPGTPGTPGALPSLWTSPSAVFLMAYFGLQSMHAYIQMGYLSQILLDSGVSRTVASLGLSINAGWGILGGLVIPTVIARLPRVEVLPLLFGALTFSGYLGLLLAPAAAPLLWSSLLGVGGWAFVLALNLIVVKARHPLVAARLSGFVQPFGYVIAALGPLVIGLVYRPEVGWTGILLALLVLALVKGVVGFLAARPGFVDDDLGLSEPRIVEN
ncbi:MFS transporter [Corynebacterium guangdongense]|uniref:CP family cyanate transporter-like MFS transporter n=1 Tax=Corynebacterium guangdongense TaxID=1783348 RepID=A0ABU1ZVH4_9CORY|nr:MFS transporter [Corynebacterium guangdongense]MDR7328855.1 CP family cyanate transporter-like MFS transporter [Corynebacterium guangdongense]WJZ17430.1 putative transporter YycB [Corynebacterium guangdongense]